ncbi:MAG: presqualene diphosphate synthase HpnD [Kiloniellaceae bacterium]
MTAADTLSTADSAAARAHARTVASRSGSSFLWGMRVLPRPRREAMYAIYAFCREVDDIADEPGATEDKLAALADWRTEITRVYEGRPSRFTACALLEAVQSYDLPKDEFLAVIDGMDMDAREAMVAPGLADFELYCRRVAGAVGCLSVRTFGARGPGPEELAMTLGEALQITNVLRDLDEDAARGRLYLPAELLEQAGIAARDPAAVLADPALDRVCAELADRARARFTRSRELLAACDRRLLKPGVLMMEVYRRILDRLERRGWAPPRQPVRVSGIEKAWIVLRHGLL